jgi:hypothetical protein
MSNLGYAGTTLLRLTPLRWADAGFLTLEALRSVI